MASRATLKEAEEVKEELKARYSTATFRIIDNSKTSMVGRALAETKGYKIVEDDGSRFVKAEVTQFDVLEVRVCTCGAEVLTAAIGEAGVDECQECRTKNTAQYTVELDEAVKRSRDKVAEMVARDEWEES